MTTQSTLRRFWFVALLLVSAGSVNSAVAAHAQDARKITDLAPTEAVAAHFAREGDVAAIVVATCEGENPWNDRVASILRAELDAPEDVFWVAAFWISSTEDCHPTIREWYRSSESLIKDVPTAGVFGRSLATGHPADRQALERMAFGTALSVQLRTTLLIEYGNAMGAEDSAELFLSAIRNGAPMEYFVRASPYAFGGVYRDRVLEEGAKAALDFPDSPGAVFVLDQILIDVLAVHSDRATIKPAVKENVLRTVSASMRRGGLGSPVEAVLDRYRTQIREVIR